MFVQLTPHDEILSLTKLPLLFSTLTPSACMDLACQIAWQGVGHTKTNPLVGAVVVDKNHRFLGAAAHLQYGGPHAEVQLFTSIQEQGLAEHLEGATLYVTLEPCAHQGKTPPCAAYLLDFPLKKVVVGVVDPNPLVNGKGLQLLKENQILTEVPEEFTQKALSLLEFFFHYQSKKTPFVGLKAAFNLSGAIGLKDSSRLEITQARARTYGHWLRQHYQSILVGAGTVIADNPTLTVRHEHLPRKRTPLRLVLDPDGRALTHRALRETNLLNHEADKTMWVCSEDFYQSPTGNLLRKELIDLGAKTLALPYAQTGFDLPLFLQQLGAMGISSTLLEGGAKIWGSFLEQDLVQKCHLFIAPTLISTANAIHWSDHFTGLKKSIQLHNISITPLDENLLLEGTCTQEGKAACTI